MPNSDGAIADDSRETNARHEWHPRIRDSVVVVRRGDSLQVTALMDLEVTEFEVDDYVFELIGLLDGLHSVSELLSRLNESHDVSRADLDDVLEVLRTERILARASLSPDRTTRFSRQRRFFDELIASYPDLPASADELQGRLQRSHVVVVGAGGAGTWVLQSLALSGVGTVSVIDPDLVELSNLNRQVLYSSRDLGMPKVEVATAALTQIGSDLRVVPYRKKIDSASDLAGILEGSHLVINCADEPSVTAASDVVAGAAHRLGIPHIVGGAYGANLGVPGVSVVPGSSTCWACIRHATASDHGGDLVPLKGRTPGGGTMAPLAGLVGNLTAWEAIRLLIGLPPALSSRILELDILSLAWRDRPIDPRPGCDCVPRAADAPA